MPVDSTMRTQSYEPVNEFFSERRANVAQMATDTEQQAGRKITAHGVYHRGANEKTMLS